MMETMDWIRQMQHHHTRLGKLQSEFTQLYSTETQQQYNNRKKSNLSPMMEREAQNHISRENLKIQKAFDQIMNRKKSLYMDSTKKLKPNGSKMKSGIMLLDDEDGSNKNDSVQNYNRNNSINIYSDVALENLNKNSSASIKGQAGQTMGDISSKLEDSVHKKDSELKAKLIKKIKKEKGNLLPDINSFLKETSSHYAALSLTPINEKSNSQLHRMTQFDRMNAFPTIHSIGYFDDDQGSFAFNQNSPNSFFNSTMQTNFMSHLSTMSKQKSFGARHNSLNANVRKLEAERIKSENEKLHLFMKKARPSKNLTRKYLQKDFMFQERIKKSIVQSKVMNRDEILVKNALKLKYEVDVNLGEKTEKKYASKLQTALDIYNHKLGSPKQSVKQQFLYQQESVYHPLAMSNILLPIKLPRNSPMN